MTEKRTDKPFAAGDVAEWWEIAAGTGSLLLFRATFHERTPCDVACGQPGDPFWLDAPPWVDQWSVDYWNPISGELGRVNARFGTNEVLRLRTGLGQGIYGPTFPSYADGRRGIVKAFEQRLERLRQQMGVAELGLAAVNELPVEQDTSAVPWPKRLP